MTGRYTAIMTAKTGEPVPCFANGSTLYSRYSPERECRSFAAQECFSQAGFYVIGGIGTGLHLKALQELHPEACIVAVEPDTATLTYLQAQNLLPATGENLHLTTLPELQETIVQTYLPAIHGNFCLQNVRSWENALLPEEKKAFEEAVRNAITRVSRDYGVQAHFGKLWNRNILQNFHLWCTLSAEQKAFHWEKPATDRCLIAAAGPTLNKSLASLSERSEPDRWIIAVDTALPVLLKHGITPHMVVTIDPQIASMRHFLSEQSVPSQTILAADLCGTPGAARLWAESGRPILFFNENHPLGLYCAQWVSPDTPPFLNISAGAGTVTHSAVELAYQLGFSEVQLIGADFGFPGNQPYARGTYLEEQWLTQHGRTNPLENRYTTLMYCTPLKRNPKTGTLTTEVLDSYREALEERMVQLQHQLPDTACTGLPENPPVEKDTFCRFSSQFRSELDKMTKNALFSVLPLAAHLKSKEENSDTLIREQIVSTVAKHLR
ncbi:MAG: DUF115 domain-containing protein [Treponemataceae bacterium]|nr:DUF115 domain-containing protein [Treponemataceae bacterium]